MESNNKSTQTKRNRKKQYNKYNQLISVEYIVLDKDEVIKADFKNLKEALNYKKNNQDTTIYILKTFKLNYNGILSK